MTPLHTEIAGNAAIVAAESRGVVPHDHALEAAIGFEAAGWSERRAEANGDLSC